METINGIFTFETKLENLRHPRGEDVFEYVAEPMPSSSKPVGKTAGGRKAERAHRRVFSSDGPHLIRHMSNDQPELRGGLTRRMTTVDSSKEAVILVDPYSTGCCVAEEIMKRGLSVVINNNNNRVNNSEAAAGQRAALSPLLDTFFCRQWYMLY
jgi:hypothetical protein